MNPFRNNFSLRTGAALVALLSWLLISNHCAIAETLAKRIDTATGAEEGGCCEKKSEKPAPGNPECPHLPQGCCKTLKVAMSETAKVPAATFQTLCTGPETWLVEAVEIKSQITEGEPLNTGPPLEATWFTELVLNRSLQSHAPPLRS